MSEQLFISDSEQNYILKRIVYVNSAEYGYAELELDQHLAIYGNNNAGKTSTLSGTKIMLFPETSFGKCEKKFMFIDKNGSFFSAEDSYQHYFPESRSFIIMEVENPHGLFSMVCYRTNNYNYARFFIPANYSDIRYLFSDNKGELNPDLSISLVAEKCKELGGIKVSDRKELADLMFGSRMESIDKSRFCVLPLRDSKPGTIEALRNIYQLAFDSGSSAITTLPAILATLVEMKRGRSQEKLNANLSSLIEARQRLFESQDWLQELENAKSTFDAVVQQMQLTKDELRLFADKYYSLISGIEVFKNKLDPKKAVLKALHDELYDLYKKSSQDLKDGENTLNELRINYKEKSRDLEKQSQDLKAALKVRAAYKNPSDDEVIRDLIQRKTEAEEELDTFKKEGGAATKYHELVREQNKLRGRQQDLSGKIKERDNLLFTSLNHSHSIDVLHSINPLLAGATYNLRPEHRSTVVEFASLFDFDATGLLTLNGSVIHPDLKRNTFDEQKQVDSWKLEFSKNTERLDELDTQLKELSDKLANDDIEGVIQDTKDQIKKLDEILKKVKSIETLLNHVNNLQEKVVNLKNKGSQLAEKVEADDGILKINAARDSHNLEKVKRDLDELEKKEQILQQLEKDLEVARGLYTPRKIKPSHIPEELTDDLGVDVINASQTYDKSFKLLKDLYDRLVDRVNHPDIDRHLSLIDFFDVEKNVNIFATTFGELEHNKDKLHNEIAGHNSTLNSQLNELRDARKAVVGEVLEIDESLNSNTVSNLSEITLKVEFEPKFESIMSTLDKHDIDGDSLLDESFYESLGKLVNGEFYNSATGRVQLRDIIKSVRYSFTKRGSGKEETKGQSGGTTTTITSFVLSVLLDRISDAHTKLKMPIIVDEIGTLDNRNKRATIEQVSKHGFSIFCATPEYLAAVSKHVGRHIHIDMNNLSNPMVESCYMKCIPDFVECFGARADAN